MRPDTKRNYFYIKVKIKNNKYYKYLHYLFRHKYYVAIECFKYGLYWRGIIHDWSKFLPSEFFPYIQSFYGEFQPECPVYSGPVDWQKKQYLEKTSKNFDRAWIHHQHLNKHHFQHWILREDSGQNKILEMPYKYAIEMFCDWVGAGIAITGKRDIVEWYEKNKEVILLHENTRNFVEKLIYRNEKQY